MSHCVEMSSHIIVTFPPRHLDLSSVWYVLTLSPHLSPSLTPYAYSLPFRHYSSITKGVNCLCLRVPPAPVTLAEATVVLIPSPPWQV